MSDTVTLTIDNIEMTVPAGTLVVDAAKQVGIDIPVFCYHPKMDPVGMCRMCLVEIGRPAFDRATREPVLDDDGNQVISYGPKLDTGCTIPVENGMVVRGFTDKVQDARNDVIEFILTSHPLDCPVCDKGGECPLQNLTMAHGPGNTRFLYDEKINLEKRVPLGDLIYLDRERCIQCARCTRFQSEVVDDPVIGFFNRGRSLEIVTYSEPGFDSYWSGNTTDICPVGALTTSDFRFGARPWELNSAAGICNQCAVGCNVTFNTRREAKTGGGFAIKRVMPRQNEQVNETWICDKGRFSSYAFAENEARLTEPLVRKDGQLVAVAWGEALDAAAAGLQAAGAATSSVVSGRLSNEDLFNVRALSNALGAGMILDSQQGGGHLTGLGEGTNIGDLGAGAAILVLASDLEEEAPVWWLRVKQAAERGATLVVANPRRTRLDDHATHSVRYDYGAEVEALKAIDGDIRKALLEADSLLIFNGSEGLGLAGSSALATACSELLSSQGRGAQTGSGLVCVWARANDQGAWDLSFVPGQAAGAKALYIAGSDPVGDHTALAAAVETADFVVVQDLFLTATAAQADVILPAQAYVEREGSYTNGERRVQRFYQTVPALPGTRADYTISAQIAARFEGEAELALEGRIAGKIFNQIGTVAADYVDLSYIQLAQVEEQWPIIGRGDLYYGGTSYDNSQGLGKQLPNSERTADVELTSDKPAGDLIGVPVTRLYDQGAFMAMAEILSSRLDTPHIVLSSVDAAKIGVSSGATIQVQLNGSTATVQTRIDDSMPAGSVRVPRSMGLPISEPMAINLSPIE